jgi:hypothetical protein
MFVIILEMGVFVNYFPVLASNCDPPDFSLPSSEGYRCEPLAPLLSLGF